MWYFPGPTDQSQSFKGWPCTMAKARQQWQSSDNKQIKQSAHKRFIASYNKRPPTELFAKTTLRPSIAVNSNRSPCFFLKGLSTTQIKWNTSFLLFVTTENCEVIIPFLWAPATDLGVNAPENQQALLEKVILNYVVQFSITLNSLGKAASQWSWLTTICMFYCFTYNAGHEEVRVRGRRQTDSGFKQSVVSL